MHRCSGSDLVQACPKTYELQTPTILNYRSLSPDGLVRGSHDSGRYELEVVIIRA